MKDYPYIGRIKQKDGTEIIVHAYIREIRPGKYMQCAYWIPLDDTPCYSNHRSFEAAEKRLKMNHPYIDWQRVEEGDLNDSY